MKKLIILFLLTLLAQTSLWAELAPTGHVEFTLPTSNVIPEDGGDYVITFNRVGGNRDQLLFRYETFNGSALAGFDYTGDSGFIHFADKDSRSQTLRIPILADDEREAAEAFNILLGTTVVTVVITDVSFQPNLGAAPEASGLQEPSKNLVDLTKGEKAEFQTKLNSPGQLNITIYDRFGRQTRQLIDMNRAASDFRDEWDGRDDSGVIVAAGVYQALIREGEKTRKLPVVILK